MAVGGVLLRFGSTGLRAIEFAASAVALGIFAYFLAILADHDLPIANRWRAVTGITGAAALYTLIATVLTCCLGGIAVFGYIAIFLDILFVGAFVAVAYLTRHGADSCSGVVNTPLGTGPSDSQSTGYGADGFGFGSDNNATYFPNLRYACRLNTVVFAISIICIFLFLITAVVQLLLIRHHKKEKAYGPSPSNNYTSGRGKTPFWKRGRKQKHHHTARDAEAATALPATHGGVRPSHETGTTIGGNNTYTTEPKYGQPGYVQPGYGQPGYGQNTTAHY